MINSIKTYQHCKWRCNWRQGNYTLLVMGNQWHDSSKGIHYSCVRRKLLFNTYYWNTNAEKAFVCLNTHLIPFLSWNTQTTENNFQHTRLSPCLLTSSAFIYLFFFFALSFIWGALRSVCVCLFLSVYCNHNHMLS